MFTIMLYILIALGIATVTLLVLMLRRGGDDSAAQVQARLDVIEKNQERTERILREEMARSREEAASVGKQLREEIGNNLKLLTDTLIKQLSTLTQSNEQRLNAMRETVEARILALQDDNSKKLEQMRQTVDEKLHATLEKRLGESFKLVSERLEMVHKGLGEMQTLASSVGDLKKVLTNVKTRGTWGEIQLESLLEQILTREQYAKNVVTKKGSSERVEFAIKLPGRSADEGEVLMPLDAKFPQEDYQRLVEAHEQCNPALADEAVKQLELRIKASAKDIRDKYLDPPHTTDFGIMFLPVEGLYAEVLRIAGLADTLQREYRVVLTGPTTLAALLNSLQMGFRTLAIEKRSSEVWMLLGAVKTEFGKFGDILEKTQDKLRQASDTIESAAKKSRSIEKRLKNVEGLPAPDTTGMISTDEEQ